MTIREFIEAIDPDLPLGVRFTTNAMPAWDPGARLTRVELAGRALPDGHVVRGRTVTHAWGVDDFSHGELMAALISRPIVAYNVGPAAWAKEKWNFMPAVVGDMEIAGRILRTPTLSLLNEHGEMGLLYDRLLSTLAEVEKQNLKLAYALDLLVASHLACHTVAGYSRVTPPGWFHPLWSVRDSSGSGRIVSSNPSISSTKADERKYFQAAPYRRWIGVRWRDAELTIMAARSGDAYFLQLAREPRPYATLATLWEFPEDDLAVLSREDAARKCMYAIIASGGDPDRLVEKHANLEYGKLAAVAPAWAEWVTRVREGAMQYGGVVSPLGVVIKAESRNALARELQEVEAECLKMFLGQMLGDVERMPDVLTGFATCIPIYNRVFYQIDIHIPIERHVDYVRRIAALEPADGLTFNVEIEVGPSWGELTRVDDEEPVIAQAMADLQSPAPSPLRCPICQGVATDEPTLREHLGDVHRVYMLSLLPGGEMTPEAQLVAAINQVVEQAKQTVEPVES